MWFRVFSAGVTEPVPTDLLECLQREGYLVRGEFRGDVQGWFHVALTIDAEDEPLELQRYLATEDGIRAELNTWAAWLETREESPHAAMLMQRVIASAQLFTLQSPEDSAEEKWLDAVCAAVCRFVARKTDGIYQIDGQGFFAGDGTLLVKEEPGP
jgi:hypothetical protein